jgi:hypothetical protein
MTPPNQVTKLHLEPPGDVGGRCANLRYCANDRLRTTRQIQNGSDARRAIGSIEGPNATGVSLFYVPLRIR